MAVSRHPTTAIPTNSRFNALRFRRNQPNARAAIGITIVSRPRFTKNVSNLCSGRKFIR